MLIVFCVMLSWTAACWFAEPFLSPFLGFFLFSVDAGSAALITAAWGLLCAILWIMRSVKSFVLDTIDTLKNNRWHYACLAAIFLLFFALQLPGLIAYAGSHNSDSAVVGLTSFHIVEGKTRPIYFYGNHYNGALVAHVTALFHLLFGKSIFHLHLVDVLFYFGFIIVIYLLAKRLWDGKVALAATLIAALPPAAVNILIRNTHVAPLIFIGALSLYLVIRIVEEDKPRWQLYLWLGVVLGFGLWVHLQTAFYGIAVVAALFFKDKLFFARPRFLTLPLGFLLGSVPVLVDVYYFPGATIWKIATQAEGATDYLARLVNGTMEMLRHLPLLFGLEWIVPGGAVFPAPISWLMIALMAAFLAFFIWSVRGIHLDAAKMRNVSIGPAIALLFPLLTWFVMSFTKEAQPPSHFRFYYILWTTVPLIFAAALYKAEGLRKWLAFGGLAIVVLAFGVTYPIYYQTRLLPNGKGVREWIDYCDRNSLSTFYGSYWHTYLTSFMTEERIIGRNVIQWRREYYAPYYRVVYESVDPPVYLFSSNVKAYQGELETKLNSLGIGYRKEKVLWGTVITGLEEPVRLHQLARISRGTYDVSIGLSSVRGVRPGDEVGSIRVVDLEVTNQGGVVLFTSGKHGYIDLEVRDAAGNVIRRQPLCEDIEPGETVNWRVLLDADEVEGDRVSARLLVNGVAINGGREAVAFALEPTGSPLPGRELDPIRIKYVQNNRICDDYLFFSGWGSMIPRGESWARESGARESEIGFFLLRKVPMQLTLVLAPYQAPGFPEHPVGVRISFNGRVLAGRLPLYSPVRLKIDLPAGYTTEGLNRLKLSYDLIEPPYRNVKGRVFTSVKPHSISINRISFRRSDITSDTHEIEYSVVGEKDE